MTHQKLVYDSLLTWALNIAREKGLTGASLFTQSCSVSCIYYHLLKQGKDGNALLEGGGVDMMPPLPKMEEDEMPCFSYFKESTQAIQDFVTNQFSNINLVDLIFFNCFDKLEEECFNHEGKDEPQIIRSALDGVPSVWIGDEFIAPKALAFDSPVKFSPYLYVVPSKLPEFRELLLALGCLQEAIADHENHLMFGSNDTLLMIPDSSGILTSAGNLVYNEAPWIENNTFDGRHFVDTLISSLTWLADWAFSRFVVSLWLMEK